MTVQKLIRFHFRKLTHQKSLYICIGIMLGMALMSAALYRLMMDTATAQSMGVSISPSALAPGGISFGLTGIDSSNFVMITGIVIVLAVCDDFEQHTVKTIFARGYSRLQMYFTKLIAVFAAVTACFVIVMAGAMAIGIAMFGKEDADAGKVFLLLGAQYIAALANAALIFMLSFMLRKTGLSIAAAIVVPTVINLIFQLIDFFVIKGDAKISGYWISSCFTILSGLNAGYDKIGICAALCAAYAVVFIMIGALTTRKTEV